MKPLAQIAVIAFALGFLLCGCFATMALYFCSTGPAAVWMLAASCYAAIAVCYFHFAEFMVAAEYRPHDASPMAFMLLHSAPYFGAQAMAWTEFVVEAWLVPEEWKWWKMSSATVFLGVALSLFFYTLRVVSMVQCGSNFALQIEYTHRDDHELVTAGLYRYFRHPAYFGWFYYAVSSQLILWNPVCTVLYAAVTWKFFSDRIPDEERALRSDKFFGDKYVEYAKRTPVGIPFIS